MPNVIRRGYDSVSSFFIVYILFSSFPFIFFFFFFFYLEGQRRVGSLFVLTTISCFRSIPWAAAAQTKLLVWEYEMWLLKGPWKEDIKRGPARIWASAIVFWGLQSTRCKGGRNILMEKMRLDQIAESAVVTRQMFCSVLDATY